MEFINISHLKKYYGPLRVLEDFNLSVSHKEKLAIIGSSGSGKSTLLRLLMTLERPDGGTITVEGEEYWSTPDGDEAPAADEKNIRTIRAKFGMVFQQFNLFPHMNVLRNVTEAPVHVLKKDKKEAEKEAASILETVGLKDKMQAYPSQLSGGQKQRVAIARAMAMHPKIMLFDEITSALDPELVGEVLGVLRDLAHQKDMTMMIVTHQMKFARDIADRIVFVDEGKVVEADAPEKIFTNPQQPRTREFLNTLLEG